MRLLNWCDQDAVLNDPNITPYFGMIPSPDMSAHICCIHAVCVGPPEKDDKYKELLVQLEGTEEIPLPAVCVSSALVDSTDYF
jgi:hypothetical protein